MRISQKQEVMMGHVRDCLTHYGESLGVRKGTREATAKKEPIAQFCGVAGDAVGRWFADTEILPRGEVLIKLMCFLSMMGYKVIELEDMQRMFRGLAELIGFGVITANQVAELLGYNADQGDSQVYRLLLKKEGGVLDHRKQLILEICKQKKEELEKKKAEADEKYYWGFVSQDSILQTVPLTAPSPVTTVKQPEAIKETLSSPSAVVCIMAGLLELLNQQEGSKGFKDKDIQIVLRLSARLSELSSKLIARRDQEKGG